MKSLFSTLLGILTISGYMFFESLIYGLFAWVAWFTTGLGALFLVNITYGQVVGIFFIIKILKFDPSKTKPIMILPKKEEE